MGAIDTYGRVAERPDLVVPQSAIIRAVRNLPMVEALALIRAAYREQDGGWCSLATAKLIYSAMRKERENGKLGREVR